MLLQSTGKQLKQLRILHLVLIRRWGTNTLFLLPKQRKYTSIGEGGGGKSLIADVKMSDL